MFDFPSGNFPKSVLATVLGTLAFFNYSARPPIPF